MGALADHESALRASLQAVYGIRLLPDGRTEPERTIFELADYVAHLPHGCALWMEVGGSLALTDAELLLREAVFRLEVIDWHETESKGPKPERIPLPLPAAEMRAQHREQQDRMAERARKHAERERKRDATT